MFRPRMPMAVLYGGQWSSSTEKRVRFRMIRNIDTTQPEITYPRREPSVVIRFPSERMSHEVPDWTDYIAPVYCLIRWKVQGRRCNISYLGGEEE